ncbi:alpha/beta hydrolase [Rhizobium leguminosarum]|uniref:Alpha/beta hydrolase n=1 Tax=Rhizobium leguminosarum TaxID=384 RepID=A0AAJ1EL40_RHILE|nr:alpha/beta hydrolase [Rhizobium leguminosarum]MBY5597728.1 alpha/beta hydrolase [Rhizobium leguminosarum]MBY5617723.1 alpha/beta hydrolase [Rhizobium leguminosarum]MBY5631269.1 alpha/beta hydrolase [Rhizobium leguminosarum]MBY5733242.1 alpha/beta hydrolase [Rhizobium leguminosarum]
MNGRILPAGIRRAPKRLKCLFPALAALMLLASAAVGRDIGPQSPASREQVEKLVGLWKDHFAGADSLQQRRTAFRTLMETTPGPTRIQVRQVDADGVDAELMWPARLHHPIGQRVILYIHGGGFSGGSIRTHSLLAGSLAKAASSDVLLIDYRLMPEYGYPAQINDALTAYRWLLDNGYRSENVVVAGDGAGGNIAIETVIRQMRAAKPLPAAVIALSPITDLAATGGSMTSNAESDPLVSKMSIESLRKTYLGSRSPTDPQASPLYADMTGFPPLLLQVGSGEVLLDDTLRLADKARRAGVDVTTEVWPGMPHQWQLFPSLLDDADRSSQNIAEFAIRHFADKPQE